MSSFIQARLELRLDFTVRPTPQRYQGPSALEVVRFEVLCVDLGCKMGRLDSGNRVPTRSDRLRHDGLVTQVFVHETSADIVSLGRLDTALPR